MAADLERRIVSGEGVLFPGETVPTSAEPPLVPLDESWPQPFLDRIGETIRVQVSPQTGCYEFSDSAGGVFWIEVPFAPIVQNWVAPFLRPFSEPSPADNLFAPWHLAAWWRLGRAGAARDCESHAGSAKNAEIAASGPRLREAAGPDTAVSNLCFTAIAFAETNLLLTAAWPTNDPLPEATLDLYASTNLLDARWSFLSSHPATNSPVCLTVATNLVPGWGSATSHVHDATCPVVTNVVLSPFNGTTVYTNVAYGCVPPPTPNEAAFFRVGTRLDTDGDGLSDAFETLVSLTDPTCADTDGDTMPDGWEYSHGLDPFDYYDSILDPDSDGLVNVYEYHAGTDPFDSDYALAPKTVIGGTNNVSSLRVALTSSEAYDIIEMASGIYSGTEWVNIFMPDHPVLLTTGNGGCNRDVVIRAGNDAETAVFWSGENQTEHTIFQGFTLALGGIGASTPIGFYVGSGETLPGTGTGHGGFFRNVTIMLGEHPSMNTGWYLHHRGMQKVILAGCVVDAKLATSPRGLYSLDGPDIILENCSFGRFAHVDGYASYGLHLHGSNLSGQPSSVSLFNCLFDASFSNSFPLARGGVRSRHNVMFDGCLMPVEHNDPSFSPNLSVAMIRDSVRMFSGGHVLTNGMIGTSHAPNRYHIADVDGIPVSSYCAIGADDPGIPHAEDDRDCDGLSAETEVFSTETNPLLADTDGDGISDGDEFFEGTDPLDASSFCFYLSGTAHFQDTLPYPSRLAIIVSNETPRCLLSVSVAETNTLFSFPHCSVSNSPLLHLCLFHDANDNGTPDNGESTSFSQIRLNGHSTFLDVAFGSITDDQDGDGLPDQWENEHGLDKSDDLDAWEDFDNDGLINLHEFWHGFDPFVSDGSNTVLSVLARSIDDRLIGKTTSNSLAVYKNYIQNATTNVFVPNADCWASGIDFSCASPWNSGDHGNWRAGTLISQRHFLMASHFRVPLNSYLTFREPNGNRITRRFVAFVSITNSPALDEMTTAMGWNTISNIDLCVGLLDSDVPDSIHPAKILPPDFAEWMKNGRGLPVFTLDQEEKALVFDMSNLSVFSRGNGMMALSMNSKRNSRVRFSEPLVTFDSGNPTYFVFDSQAILIGCLYSGGAGGVPSCAFYHAEIQAAMDELCVGYALQFFDFSEYPRLNGE